MNDLKTQIQKEKSLTMTMPRFMGIIRVKPSEKINRAMQSDTEIEAIGMDIAMKYESSNGRTPEDVSSQNLGFDIRSIDKDGVARYIEVKARAESGDIAMTQNEWFKAHRFKEDYYLYVVFNASLPVRSLPVPAPVCRPDGTGRRQTGTQTGKSPQLFIIQNPSERVHPDERVEIVRYIVGADEIKNEGELV